MMITYRVRLNVRLPDAEKKYRDELTQEAEVSLDESDPQMQGCGLEDLAAAAQKKTLELRSSFYREAKRLGAADYAE